ncbi:MAG: hypothetical protein COZ06_04315 [Armatimonadetes bacterium CG_4_10_14_3_um_filter_66_18]|nr:MAG: hypothetical protein COZ57_16325 [Armatimonadetes bacterium CG_4_8_14_3_um_filter_66_20]PIY51587.1 MAG: hypothetical protein COZ06_04315 [Armatimonadetes bacterium CG_4_10_14_3_um_filter_66_18]PIZ43271.1 MAG: hypothetical protein COY42_16070 [Armatimonadetes bacterium CG_4_10_14_0_8_um_filter_66_14]PJB73752.1 MAG: hypothetical protein CO096_05155 [Armatimonadetes bacterium CG_4_9_14_3_um_filter_66_14]
MARRPAHEGADQVHRADRALGGARPRASASDSRLPGDIFELRVRHGSVNYRMRYFFHEQRAVLSHGLTQEREVPRREIDLTRRRLEQFRRSPHLHTDRE